MAKIGIFDLPETYVAAYFYIEGVVSRTTISVPDNVDKIDMYVDDLYSGIIERVYVFGVLTYRDIPVYNIADMFWGPPEHFYINIDKHATLAGRKLDLALYIVWVSSPRVPIKDYYDSVWPGVLHLDFYSGNALVGREDIDVAIYSPDVLLDTVGESYSANYAVIPLSDYVVERLDYILVQLWPRYGYLAVPAIYITELDEADNVVAAYRTVINCVKLVPKPFTKKILVTIMPRGDPRSNYQESMYITLYGKHIEGLPVNPPPPP